jgi:hypothetical protein
MDGCAAAIDPLTPFRHGRAVAARIRSRKTSRCQTRSTGGRDRAADLTSLARSSGEQSFRRHEAKLVARARSASSCIRSWPVTAMTGMCFARGLAFTRRVRVHPSSCGNRRSVTMTSGSVPIAFSSPPGRRLLSPRQTQHQSANRRLTGPSVLSKRTSGGFPGGVVYRPSGRRRLNKMNHGLFKIGYTGLTPTNDAGIGGMPSF